MKSGHIKTRKIRILTPGKTQSWMSMKEIIGSHELLCASLPGRMGSAKTIRLGMHHRNRALYELVDASLIIVLALNNAILKALNTLRGQLNYKGRLLVFEHGEASSLMFGGGKDFEFFRKDDVLIAACESSASLSRRLYRGLRVEQLPFPIIGYWERTKMPSAVRAQAAQTKPGDAHRIVYAGRISEQKNLHTVLVALTRLDKKFEFHVYGVQDGFGSPLMGFAWKNYQRTLKIWAKKLGISKQIHWHGYKPALELRQALSEMDLFVSASLHSDEDFGLAAVMALEHGLPAVLTDWGGHRGHRKIYGKAVRLVPVRQSAFGPWVHPDDLAQAIQRQLQLNSSDVKRQNKNYDFQVILKGFVRILDSLDFLPAETACARSELLRKALESQAGLAKDRVQLNKKFKLTRFTRVYRNYADPLAHEAFVAYGMKRRRSAKTAREELMPWVRRKAKAIIVEDPHRGYWVLRGADASPRALREAGWLS